jgi:hypothetical protein
VTIGSFHYGFATAAVENRTGLTDQLGLIISGNLSQGMVGRNDGAVHIHDHDTILNRIHHGFPVPVQRLIPHHLSFLIKI